jgi:hypothetical protein
MIGCGAVITLAAILPVIAAFIGLHPPARPAFETGFGIIGGVTSLILGLSIRYRGAKIPSLPSSDTGAESPKFSEDGKWWWDGAQWQSATSPDNRWRWSGEAWVPNQTEPPDRSV